MNARSSRPMPTAATALPPHLVEAVREVTRPGMRVFDLGCGQRVHEPLIRFLGASYVGAGAGVSGRTLITFLSPTVYSTPSYPRRFSSTCATPLRPPPRRFGSSRPVDAFLASWPFWNRSTTTRTAICRTWVLGQCSSPLVSRSSACGPARRFSVRSPVICSEDCRSRSAAGWPWPVGGSTPCLAALRGYSAVARSLGRRGPDLTSISYVVAGSIGFIARKPA